MAFAPLSDLPLGRAHCAVCVRVVRLWDYCGNKEDEPPLHVDMILVDDKKNWMYAEIPGAEAGRFKTLIKEGQVYVLKLEDLRHVAAPARSGEVTKPPS
ncbi:unnamed protein product [Urochloa humidicola]